MKFRKRVKLFPGVNINLSQAGISTTIGVKGASVNIGKKGMYLNTNIPGTGFYNRTKIASFNTPAQGPLAPAPPNTSTQPAPGHPTAKAPATESPIASKNVEAITSPNLEGLKQTLIDCYKERNLLTQEIANYKAVVQNAKDLRLLMYFLIVGFFTPYFKKRVAKRVAYLNELIESLNQCVINVDIECDERMTISQNFVNEAFDDLITCHYIWDWLGSNRIDRAVQRTRASVAISRKRVAFAFAELPFVKSTYEALHLENANGGDLYIYPGFIIILNKQKELGLVDLRKLKIDFKTSNFIEEDVTPDDAEIVDTTWKWVNKNGMPDRRYANNYEIDICQYGVITLSTSKGLHEAYGFSNFDKAVNFVSALTLYRDNLKGKKA